MKKFLMFLCAVMLIFGVTGMAGAVPISFTDTTVFTPTGTILPEDYVDHGWGAVNKLNWTGDFVKWTHHFDFDPAAAEVLSGKLTLSLRDDEADTWNPFTWDVGIGWAEDGTWDIGDVDSGLYGYDVTASYLVDGTFTVTLGSVWGDFYIGQSNLDVTYAPVPEPSTILLMGIGLLGLVGYSRKRFNKKS